MSIDSPNYPSIDYDDNSTIVWKRYGETIHYSSPVDLTENSKQIATESEPLFKYFLDGSRRTYKVDDISFSNQIYPVIAGQVGVGCCKREDRRLKNSSHYRHNVIALPRCADKDGWKPELFFNKLLSEINENQKNKKHGFQFDRILIYEVEINENVKLENKGVAKIQDYMIDFEKRLVSDIVRDNLLSSESYLIKDGSLEYKKMASGDFRELAKIRNNYRYIIGVSKSFNPERCKDNTGRINSKIIANLKLFHRTPVYMYQSEIASSEDDKVMFAIWYVRIRDKKYTKSPYEGILKIEKILTTEKETQEGMDSETVDLITANLINERNPVCWKIDSRWANHLYPIYLTESYIKSLFVGSNYFLNIF